MKLVEAFLKQPFTVIVVEIYLFFVLLLMVMIFPTFILSLIAVAFTVLSIMYLIVYCTTKE